MEREELLRNLKQVREKEKDRKYSVGQLNVFNMVSDVIDYLEHEEKPKMTNLEKFKDEIKKAYLEQGYLGDAIYKFAKQNGYKYSRKRRNENDQYLVDWLLEEYKEPIKLKQWEKDLIEAYQERLGVDHAFYSNYILEELKERGHFKGVMDTSMNTQIILENCEIVEDDYEDFEECK